MPKNHSMTRLVALWTTFILFLLVTNPTRLPVVMLVAPFGILFVAMYETGKTVLTKYAKYAENRVRNMSIAGSSILTIGLALQSLGQLTIRDVIVAGLAVAVGYFYIGRTSQA